MNKIDFDHEHYLDLCEAYREKSAHMKEDKKVLEKLRQDVIVYAGGDRFEHGIEVSYKSKRGTVDHQALLEFLKVDEEVIERFRKPGTDYWNVRSY